MSQRKKVPISDRVLGGAVMLAVLACVLAWPGAWGFVAAIALLMVILFV